jgi:predicted CopG family antitoxin
MSKLIAVSDEAYEKLKCLKNGNSFSKTILQLIEKPKKKSLLEVINSWDNESREKFADSVEAVYKERKKWKLKRVEL